MSLMAQGVNTSKENLEYWASGCNLSPHASDYIKTASSILLRDYPRLNCGELNQVYAWDADSYEKVKNKCRNVDTVDMVFSFDKGKMLMVEAKLDVKNVDNLKKEVEAKILHTKEYLVSSTTFKSMVSPSVVLFGQDHFDSKYSRFRKMRNNKGDIIPMTLPQFCKCYIG